MNVATGMRARSLTRRFMWATVALGIFAGVAGGSAIGIWGIGRRTATVYDRFVAYEGASQFGIFACPDGVSFDEILSDFQAACGAYDYADLREFLAGVPGVEASGRFTVAISYVASAADPNGGWRQLVPVAIDAGAFPALGTPIIVDGRLADPAVATEVTINEEAAQRLSVGVGDQLIVTPYRIDEFDQAGEGVEAPGGIPTTMTVVGVTRRPVDLVGRLGGTSIYEDTSAVTTGPAWWNKIDGDAANYAIGLGVTLAPGTTSADVMRAVWEWAPDKWVESDEGGLLSSNGSDSVVDAIRMQSIGLELIALVVALAGVVFAGQAIARQARREWDDAETLDALGMTRSGMISAAAWRTTATAAVAAIVAVVVAVALSPLGPIGIGRAAEPHPGAAIDGLTLAVGLPLVAAVVLLSGIAPVLRIRRRARADTFSTSSSRSIVVLPPTGVAGLAMTTSRRAGGVALLSAVIGVSLACAAGVAAWSLVSSYDDLVAHPARYGSAWDAQVGNVGSPEQQTATRARLAAIPGIRAVGIKSTEGLGDDPHATLMAGEPFLGEVAFGTITDGRAPVGLTEIALGRQTMRALDTQIGESVDIANPNDPSQQFPFDVVGEVVINDALGARPGSGGLVTNEAFDAMETGTSSQTYAVWIDPDGDRAATVEALKQAFPTTYVEHTASRRISNLGLVSNQPALLAAIVGLLAGAALVHALVTSVLRGRRQIGILKTLGFTRGQVTGSIAWHASALAMAALIVGIPLGVIIGRVVWSSIVDHIGLVSAPVVSIPAIAAVAVLVLLVANLAALGPGIAAARTRPVAALRAE